MKKLCMALMCLGSIACVQNISEDLKKVIDTDNIKDKKAQESINEWVNEKFGLTPYRPNYLLPLSYTSHNYKSYTPTDGTYKNVEAEFQVSLKLAFKKNILGLGEVYYGAYTQHSWWQLYIESSPFRETNYNPELFVVFPIDQEQFYGLKTLEVGYSHLSNGQGNIDLTDNADAYPEFENRSRSINVLYTKFIFQQRSFLIDLKFWIPIANLDDNPDIVDYYGYGRLKLMYFYKKNLFTFRGRLNPIEQKGAFEVTYSYPALLDGVYFYSKIFSGYGESLIDYDTYLTKYSIGISFSR